MLSTSNEKYLNPLKSNNLKKRFVRIMIDVDGVKLKLGAIFGFIGSTILLIVGLGSFTMNRYMIASGNVPIFIPYITSIVTSAISAFGMYGAVMVFRDNFTGYTFLLLAGIIGIIGTFIPIYAYVEEWGYTNTFYLSGSGAFIDLVFMVVGGILGFALAEKKERKE